MARNKFDIDETLETSFNASHLKRSLVYAARYKGRLLAGFLLSVASSLISLTGPKFIERAIGEAIPNSDTALLIKMSCMLAGSILISVLLGMARGFLVSTAGQNIIRDIRHDLFSHLQKLPFSYYDSRPHGKILVRVVHYVNNVADMLSNGIINIIIEILNVVFIIIFMLNTDVELTLVTVAGLPVVVAVVFLLKPLQRRAMQQISNKGSNLTAYTAENIDGVRITQMFARQDANKAVYHKLTTAASNAWLKAIKVSLGVSQSTDYTSRVVTAMLYLVGILWLKPAASPALLLAMAAYADRFWAPILNLANLYNNVINSMSYLERIFETIDESVSICDAPDAVTLEPFKGEVEFKDVTFGYEEGQTVLDNVNFKVEKGQSVALVGPTGAGKSTVINLISRFYDVRSGKVYIDGQDISKGTLESLRGQLGIMMQDTFIFSTTVEENIRYGRLDATEEEIIEAAKAVCAHDFIMSLPNGYKTELSERGGSLSAGQKQLISFARTMLSDPKVLILDEATSSIDARTEQLLQIGIARLLEGRTSFIVAHRLSTIENCDVIMYIAGGKVAESGNHAELMAKKGHYHSLRNK